MIATQAVARIVRRQAVVLKIETGEKLDFEVAPLDPPAGESRCEEAGAADTGAACKITIAAFGQQQLESETVLVQAPRRPLNAAIERAAAAPEIEAAEIEKLLGICAAAGWLEEGRGSVW
jgi:hypothetical protein